MHQVKKQVRDALAELDDVTIITSSWAQAKKQTPALPAIVVDLDRVVRGEVTEGGTVLSKQHTLAVSAIVKLQGKTEEEADDDLDALTDKIEDVLQSLYGDGYEIQEWFARPIEHGKMPALCGSFSVTIEVGV